MCKMIGRFISLIRFDAYVEVRAGRHLGVFKFGSAIMGPIPNAEPSAR